MNLSILMGIMWIDNNFQNHAVGYQKIEVLAIPNFVTARSLILEKGEVIKSYGA
jgi:hypothetical protein